MKNAPYGTWESVLTPEFVCKGASSPWETKIDGEACYWTEQRPSEQGRTVIVKWTADEGTRAITPNGYSARTKVYVYGGSSFCVKGDVIHFVNDKDQCIYSQNSSSSEIKQLTLPGLKYAELSPTDHGLVALIETPEEKNFIGFIDASTGKVSPLVEGADFYSSATLSPDAKKIAWIEWNHPYMSWDESSLWVGDFDGTTICNKIKVAGEKKESLSQPIWKDATTLGFISDRTGWWNLYEWNGNAIIPLCPVAMEFGVPQWRFNNTWGYRNGIPICAYKDGGAWKLGSLERGKLIEIDLPFNSYSQVRTEGSKTLFIAGSPTKVFAVYLWEQNTLVQLSTDSCVIPEEWISLAQPMTFPTSAEKTKIAYGLFYPPTNPQFYAEGPPPVIVKIHGGPTGAAEVSLRPSIQFWTTRGFALFDVDYTGSTGYGRAYRDALNGAWGIADRDDILWGVRYLVEHQLVDPKRLYISGGSAGGFTLLRVLAAEDLFSKAVCYYGVSDLEALAKETHKFEKHYLDQLVAPYPEQREVYIERSPIHEVDKIRASMLIFQGLDDQVVPPDQSQALYESLQANGVPAELVLYGGEGHGFRGEKTILDTLEREVQFLR